MNRKGQALVEFVIIIPIFIMMIFTIIDFGIILYNMNKMEIKMEDVVTMYKSNSTYKNIEDYLNKDDNEVKLTITNDNNEDIKIVLSKEIKLITPGLGLIIGDPYNAEAKRVIDYES